MVFEEKNENSLSKTTDKTNDLILKENINYFENPTEELKERDAYFEKNVIDVFEEGRYNEEICSVYYELLSKNVSINDVESVIRILLQKMAAISCGKLPKKSFAAEFFNQIYQIFYQKLKLERLYWIVQTVFFIQMALSTILKRLVVT